MVRHHAQTRAHEPYSSSLSKHRTYTRASPPRRARRRDDVPPRDRHISAMGPRLDAMRPIGRHRPHRAQRARETTRFVVLAVRRYICIPLLRECRLVVVELVQRARFACWVVRAHLQPSIFSPPSAAPHLRPSICSPPSAAPHLRPPRARQVPQAAARRSPKRRRW